MFTVIKWTLEFKVEFGENVRWRIVQCINGIVFKQTIHLAFFIVAEMFDDCISISIECFKNIFDIFLKYFENKYILF